MKRDEGRRLLTGSRRVAAIGGAAVATVLGMSVAWGEITSGQEQITACVGPSGGLRVIDYQAGERCKGNETQLQWSSGALALEDGSVEGGLGGVVADKTIDSFDLKDGSVVGGPGGVVADQTIDGFDIKDGSITHSELMTVDADGLGAVTANKISHGAVTGIAISEDAVSEDKLSFEVATQAELDASNERLFDLEGFDSALGNDDSTPNESSDPVSWSKLKNIPSAFADGEIHTTEFTGVTFSTVSSGMVEIASGSRASVLLSVPGISPNDFLSVPPPAVLADGLVFGGAAVAGEGLVTVYLHNVRDASVTQAAVTYNVNWIDLTP